MLLAEIPAGYGPPGASRLVSILAEVPAGPSRVVDSGAHNVNVLGYIVSQATQNRNNIGPVYKYMSTYPLVAPK
jgi:hypothetical protein